MPAAAAAHVVAAVVVTSAAAAVVFYGQSLAGFMRPHIKQLLPNGKRQLRCVTIGNVVSVGHDTEAYAPWPRFLAKQQQKQQQQQQQSNSNSGRNSNSNSDSSRTFPGLRLSTRLGGTETGTGPVTACIGLQTFFRVSASAAIYVYK